MKKLLVVLLVLGMVAPAMAAEWNMYGSARMALFYNTYDENASGIGEDDTDLAYALQGNSRIGAKVKTSDQVTGRFEYGTGVNVRLLYGEYHFGGGSLLAGQDYTPVNTLNSNQVLDADDDLSSSGMLFERQPQLKVQFGGFQLALLPVGVNGVQDTVDVVLPKIELAYDMKSDAFNFGVYGLYQTYDDAGDNAVMSYLIGVRPTINMGPAYINFNGYYAQNIGNTTIGGLIVDNYDSYRAADDEDATTYALALAVGAKISDMLAVEVGAGYVKSELGDAEEDGFAVYAQMPITLAPGVSITPEIDYKDFGDDDTGVAGVPVVDQGTRFAFGAKFQINF